MLSPEYLLRISEGAEEIAEYLHGYLVAAIVRRINSRLGRGADYLLTATDKWNVDVLQDAGFLLEDIQQEITRHTKLQSKEIAEAMEAAGIEALKYDDEVYRAAGLSPKALDESPEMIRIMQRNYEATMGEWENFTKTTADVSQQLFINQCDKAYHLVSTGAESYTTAYTDAIKEIIDDGVYVEYTNETTGRVHRDTIETATLRCVRTGIGQMALEVGFARMKEMEWDTVLVSAHEGARPGDGGENPGNHAWWQGKYYSMSGAGEFPPLSLTGYGTGEGLGGWNCRHSAGPGSGRDEDNPYSDIDKEKSLERYKTEQRQRTLERRIRATKRKIVGYQAAMEGLPDGPEKDAARHEYEKRCDLLRTQNEAYRSYCEQHDLRPLNERIAIAEWDRKQAKESLKAARRYRENKHE